MRIMNNCRVLVDTHLTIMNNIMLANMGQHISAAIPLNRIAIFQVLRSSILYNTLLELAEQENMDSTQQVFGLWNKHCEDMEVWIP